MTLQKFFKKYIFIFHFFLYTEKYIRSDLSKHFEFPNTQKLSLKSHLFIHLFNANELKFMKKILKNPSSIIYFTHL